jgi:plasmid stabilization system protein ParE
MGSKPPRLTVSISPLARRDLDLIWEWNAETYGPDRADAYDAFLLQKVATLQTGYSLARSVLEKPECQYIIARRSSRGHGHYLVFQVFAGRVEILRIFHTRQDWQSKL